MLRKFHKKRRRNPKERLKVEIIFFIFIFISVFVLSTQFISAQGITGVVRQEQRSPKQLFDITFELDSSIALSAEVLVARVTFVSFGTEPTPINLTFIILDELGNRVYLEEDSLIVETENIFTKKFENLDLEIGKYILLLNTIYNEDVEDGFWKEFEIKSRVGKSINQLFDIKFELSDSSIRTTENFGTEPTPVDMEFIVLNEFGEEVYREKDYLIVETEKVFNKEFEGSRFEAGEYTFVLKTVYNVDVEDEFRRKFEVKEFVKYRLGLWISVIINVLFFSLVLFLLRKQEGINIKDGGK